MVGLVEFEHEEKGEIHDLFLVESGYFVSSSATDPLPFHFIILTHIHSAGICGIIRTTGLNALTQSSDYLCEFRNPLSVSGENKLITE